MSVAINLLPTRVLFARRVRARRQRWIAACAVMSAAGMLATIAVRASLRDPRALTVELDRARERLALATAEGDRVRASLGAAQQRLSAIGGLADRPNWKALLAVIARSRLDRTVIDAVELKKAPPAPAPASAPAGSPPADDGAFIVTIRGRAEGQRDLTALALAFERIGIFDTVRQERLNPVRSRDRELLEFEFTCRLAPRGEKPEASRER